MWIFVFTFIATESSEIYRCIFHVKVSCHFCLYMNIRFVTS
uniref:Uncharacterized protein n=1 Tax=Rhizophora mucronata TaxID=61149 RepID=A0A2P2L2P6_RHIMU